MEVLARWFYKITGQPPVIKFNEDKLSTNELMVASYCLSHLGKYSEALAICQRIFEILPDREEVWYTKGIILNDLGRCKKALDCLNKALELNPNNSSNWSVKGIVLKDLGLYDQAIECYDTPLEINPQYSAPWFNKGVVLC